MKPCSWWCLPLAQADEWLPQNHMAAFSINPSKHRNYIMLWICLSLFSVQNCNQKIKVNFRFLRANIKTTIILEKALRSHRITWWSKFGRKKERKKESYYPYAKPEETSVGTGDKPLLTAYLNVSEKHFTYGNTCLRLGGFTLRTRFLYKLKTESEGGKKNTTGAANAFLTGCVFFHLWLLGG